MIKILSRVTDGNSNNKINIRAKIAVDTADDLTADYHNYHFTLGSIAWDVSTGDIYAVDSSGTWHKQSQSIVEVLEAIQDGA